MQHGISIHMKIQKCRESSKAKRALVGLANLRAERDFGRSTGTENATGWSSGWAGRERGQGVEDTTPHEPEHELKF